jgi:hypothetical protein
MNGNGADVLLNTVRKLTINSEEVQRRLDEMMADEKPLTVEHVAYAMRNLGKPPGQEREVGQATEPLPDAGYPSCPRGR